MDFIDHLRVRTIAPHAGRLCDQDTALRLQRLREGQAGLAAGLGSLCGAASTETQVCDLICRSRAADGSGNSSVPRVTGDHRSRRNSGD